MPEKNFTELLFLRYFFPLLKENGVYQVNEIELMEKFAEYRTLKEYENLFENMKESQDGLWNIRGELLVANYFGIITYLKNNPQMISLGQSIELAKDRGDIPEQKIEQLQKLVQDFSKILKLEQRYQLEIHRKNPNGQFYLYNDDEQRKGWNLITDGMIIEEKDVSKELRHSFLQDPVEKRKMSKYKELRAKRYQISNASFILWEGYKEAEIKRKILYTFLEQKEMENQMMKKNITYDARVRKITLK